MDRKKGRKVKYNSKLLDGIMKELGWNKFEDVGVFWKESDDYHKKVGYKYFISFPIDWYAYYKIYEDAYKDEKITIDKVRQVLKDFSVMTANTYCKEEDLEKALLMLAGDFCYHNSNRIKSEYFESRLKELI